MTNDQEKIRQLAYDLWIADGRPEGREVEFWLRAESQILASAKPSGGKEKALKADKPAAKKAAKPEVKKTAAAKPAAPKGKRKA